MRGKEMERMTGCGKKGRGDVERKRRMEGEGEVR
jgi:hypothetical protein